MRTSQLPPESDSETLLPLARNWEGVAVIGSRLFGLLVLRSLGMVDSSGGGSDKLIAVAALSLDESAEISAYAAHAPNFLIFDNAGTLKEIVPNPYANLHEEVGDKVVELLQQHNVRLMIAGDFGSHLAEALDSQHIAHIKDIGLANIAVSAHRRSTG